MAPNQAGGVHPGESDDVRDGTRSAGSLDPGSVTATTGPAASMSAPTGPALAPQIEAHRLGLRTRQGPVFERVDLTVHRGQVAGIVGRAGSGRSALLLTLAGRMRGWSGTLRVAGLDVATHSREVRQRVSLARVADLVDLEHELVVSSAIAERALIDGIQPAVAEQRLAAFEDLIDTRIPRDQLVGRLSALQQTLLGLGLAVVRPAEVVVLDDADRGLDLLEQTLLGDAIAHLAGSGVTLVMCVIDVNLLPPGATVVRLADPTPVGRPDPAPPAHHPEGEG